MSKDLPERLRYQADEARRNYPEVFRVSEEIAYEAADYIEKLEAANLKQSCIKIDDQMRIEKLEAVTKDDARWLAAYHMWCKINGCAPSSSDLIAARKTLEGKDER